MASHDSFGELPIGVTCPCSNFESCVEKGALRQKLTRHRFPVVDGETSVPEEPGLGVDLDEETVAKYRVG